MEKEKNFLRLFNDLENYLRITYSRGDYSYTGFITKLYQIKKMRILFITMVMLAISIAACKQDASQKTIALKYSDESYTLVKKGEGPAPKDGDFSIFSSANRYCGLHFISHKSFLFSIYKRILFSQLPNSCLLILQSVPGNISITGIMKSFGPTGVTGTID